MGKKEKTYKVTYKTYHNPRLKEIMFHTKKMRPLYVQVIFDRIPIIFKSYYYDLFSKSKYAIRISGRVHTPDIKEIIKKEETLIEFIVDKNLQNFSLDLFKKEYAFYCRDLLDIMEESFLDYLFNFLHDEGLPYLADTINKGAQDCKMYDLLRDFKKALNPTLYKKLIENSYHYAPPYLPLYAFAQKPQSTPFTMLSMMEWEQPETKENFVAFFKNHSPEYDLEIALNNIRQWVNQ